MPSHGYVPSCCHRLMRPMFIGVRYEISLTVEPQENLFWYCKRCGRVLKDVWRS